MMDVEVLIGFIVYMKVERGEVGRGSSAYEHVVGREEG